MKRIYSLQPLERSGSKEMNLDGSSSNKIFKFDPTGSDRWIVKSIHFFMLDPGTMDHDKFGAITALTNGLRFIIKIDGTELVLKDIVDI